MSYLVLARKYRPQTFEEVVGQEHVTRTLQNAITRGRVHHAFLFCGARGVGKTTAARILAKCLSCVNAPTAAPCNQCDACREITAGTSVDVQEIDGASNNSVEDVRTLRENVRYLPVRGKKKVYIIDEVHMLSSGAFNALLKTLEEPPEHAVFIFATTEVHKIPITILSRLQRYDFRLVSVQRIAEHLGRVLGDEAIAFEQGALQVVAREAGGSVRDSLSLLEQVLAVGAAQGSDGPPRVTEQAAVEALGVADRALVADLGRAILAKDAPRALTLVGAACERSVDWKHLAHALLEHLRDLVVARVVADPSSLIEGSDNEVAELVKTASEVKQGLLEALFDRFARVAEDVSRSPLPRYAFEVGLVELTHVEPLEPVGELVERLVELEGRLGSGAPRPASEATRAAGGVARVEVAAPRTPVERSAAPVERAAPTTKAAPALKAAVAPPTSWLALAEQLAERNFRYTVFLQAREVEFAPPRIRIAFEKVFDAEQARDKLPDARAIVRELCGADATLEVVEGAGHAPSAIEAEEARAREDRERRKKEALDHPARKLLTAELGDDLTFKEPEVE